MVRHLAVLLERRGAKTLFCGIWTYDAKVIEFQSFYEFGNSKEIIFYFEKFINFLHRCPNPTKQSPCTPSYIEISISIKNATSHVGTKPLDSLMYKNIEFNFFYKLNISKFIFTFKSIHTSIP